MEICQLYEKPCSAKKVDTIKPPDAKAKTCYAFSSLSATLDMGLLRTLPWLFLVAGVRQAILGADFLHHFGLSVDVARSVRSASPLSGISISALHSPYAAVLKDFPSLTQPPDWSRPVAHDVVHHIQTTGAPVFARARQLAPEKLKIAKAEFEHMLSIGVARPSYSNWSSALHMVPKETDD
ncbi:uncharacterized protein LOC135389303 [Ornithodoros turicata]|uniref:uncharacterized protein LOC135389303 n=1 Tax=Ornithodoros turicata TaxID=34597 RepID=UPI003139369D